MLSLNQEQMRTLRQRARRLYVAELHEHVQAFFAQVAEQEGPEATRNRLDAVLEEAGGYQLVTRSDLCKFVDLCYLLGDGFIRRNGMEWAREMLGQPSPDAMSNVYEIVIRQLELRGR